MSDTLFTSGDFTEIPANWQLPGSFTEVTPIQSGQGLTAFPARALIIGHIGYLGAAKGPATPGVAYPVYSLDQAASLFGINSAVYECYEAFNAGAPTIPVDIIGVPDTPANAPQAVWTISFVGEPGQATTTALSVNGVRYPFAVDPASNAANWAANLAAAFADLPNWLVAAVVGNNVTLTSFQGGADANDFSVRPSPLVTDLAPGLTINVVQTQVSPSNPSLAAALAGVSATWYTDIVTTFSDLPNLQLLSAEGARRYKALAKLDCRIYYGFRGTYGQVLALGDEVNSQFMSCFPASNPFWTPWRAAGAYAAACAFALNQDPARQLRTLVLPALAGLAPLDIDLYSDEQRNVLLSSGMSTFTVQQDGTVLIERAVTNYQTSATGVPDGAWQDIMVPSTMTRVRYDWDAYVQSTYPRSKLCPDGSIAAQYADNAVTPSMLKASWTARCKLYEQYGWLENTTTTSALANISIDPSNKNRVNEQLPVEIIGNAMIIATSLQFEV